MRTIPDQHGRVALVTGANTGLGYQTALALARAGAVVTLAVRNTDKGAAAVHRLRTEVPDADVSVAALDLADLESVRRFALDWTGRLDILVANAGLMLTPSLQYTLDGFEMQMGTNHLGHYALIGRLLPWLRESTASRVVSLSSIAHRGAGRLDRGLGLTGQYAPMRMYGQSKLATAMFAVEFDRRLRAAGENITSVTAHPGWSATDLFNRTYDDKPGPIVFVSRKVSALLGSSPAHGAQSQILAAVAPGLTGGEYVGPRLVVRGEPGVTTLSKWAHDPYDGRWLWDESAELTGVDFALAPA